MDARIDFLKTLVYELKVTRQLQKRYWNAEVRNAEQMKAKKELLEICKAQEARIDHLLNAYDEIRQITIF